ncbi:MAG: RNB domain-containing ribonuclease, partial [Ruminococcus sp.]|nr:RNB domain-containing ribonuclease [Ruminococcus sp.]
MAGKTKKKASEKKGADQVSIESYKNKIVTFLKANGKKTMPVAQLETKCRTKKNGRENFAAAFAELRDEGVVTVRKGMKAALCSELGLKTGEVTRLSRTFGFAMTDSGVEYFIPGKCMLGAMPHDRVLIADIASRSGEPEGEIVDILSFGSSTLTGRIERVDGELFLVPDIASRNHMIIAKDSAVSFAEGDKVLAEIVSRGRRHAEHKVRITSVFGSSELAQSCAKSILSIHGAPEEFPADALKEARRISEGGVQEYSFNNREDLRGLPIFTIDSAESKDLDDAVSVSRTEKGYLLGVHIADVSHYVRGNSELDKEALRRGTSIYYADKVIPMLPKELSNGICSLNPDEDRLTLSAFTELSPEGELLSYRFCKSVIRSRVKGVYKEINAILDGSADSDITAKYACVAEELPLMNELADVLIDKKQRRHAPELETTESKLIIGE